MTEKSNTIFGRILAQCRKNVYNPDNPKPELTQSKLATKIDFHPSNISYWETGKRPPPSRETVVKIIEVLCEEEYLTTLKVANQLLKAADYRSLDVVEIHKSDILSARFRQEPGVIDESYILSPRNDQITIQKPDIHSEQSSRRNQLEISFLNAIVGYCEERLAYLLSGGVTINLDFKDTSHLVDENGKIRPPLSTNTPLETSKQIFELYNRAGKQLLVTGSRGSGKTVLLLRLARHLAKQALEDTQSPIPIILNCSSFSDDSSLAKRRHKKPKNKFIYYITNILLQRFTSIFRKLTRREFNLELLVWAEFEIKDVFKVNINLHEWFQKNNLVLLLDGLDEVDPAHKHQMIKAINELSNCDEAKIVVTLFVKPDEVATNKIHFFGGEIELLPINTIASRNYLGEMGEQGVLVQEVLDKHPDLANWTQNPLRLRVFIDVVTIIADVSIVDEETLWRLWVAKHIKQGKENVKFPKEKVIPLFFQLAYWMQRFVNIRNGIRIDDLQPDLLESPVEQQRYYLLSSILVLFAGGVMTGSALFLANLLDGSKYPPATSAVIVGIVFGLLLGSGYRFLPRAAFSFYFGAICALSILIANLLNASSDEEILLSIFLIPLFSGMSGILYRRGIWGVQRDEISLSKLPMLPNLGFGLWFAFCAFSLVLVGSIFRTMPHAARNGLAFFTFIILTLLTFRLVIISNISNEIQSIHSSNYGLKQSAITALIMGSTFGLVGGLVFFVILDGAGGINGMVFSLQFGLIALIQHFSLRVVLASSNQIYFNYADFLNYGRDLGILTRTQGKYAFFHPELRDYLAAQYMKNKDI